MNGHQLYGLRKGKSTYSALITIRVIYDVARAQRDYNISIFNDLKGCYDHVRPAVNTITTRRIGLPKTAALCHAIALRKMKHKIRTGFGISSSFLQWDKKCNSGGIGQGNGGASTSWHSHMLPLEKAYEAETGRGVEYSNPDKTRRFFQWLVGYVDDNTILIKMERLGYDDPAVSMMKEAKKCMET